MNTDTGRESQRGDTLGAKREKISRASAEYKRLADELNNGQLPNNEAVDGSTLEIINENNIFGKSEHLMNHASNAGLVEETWDHAQTMDKCLILSHKEIDQPFLHHPGETYDPEKDEQLTGYEEQMRGNRLGAPLEAAANAVRRGDSKADRDALRVMFDKEGINDKVMPMVLEQVATNSEFVDHVLPADVDQQTKKPESEQRENIAQRIEQIAVLERKTATDDETPEDKLQRGGLYIELLKELLSPDSMSRDGVAKLAKQEMYSLLRDEISIVGQEVGRHNAKIADAEQQIKDLGLKITKENEGHRVATRLASGMMEEQRTLSESILKMGEQVKKLESTSVSYKEMARRLEVAMKASDGVMSQAVSSSERVLPGFADKNARRESE